MLSPFRIPVFLLIIGISSIFWWVQEQVSWLWSVWGILLWIYAMGILALHTTPTQKADMRSFLVLPFCLLLYGYLLYSFKINERWFFFIVLLCVVSFFLAVDVYKYKYVVCAWRHLTHKESLFLFSVSTGAGVVYVLDVLWENMYLYGVTISLLVYLFWRWFIWCSYTSLRRDIFVWLLLCFWMMAWSMVFFHKFF